MLACASVLLRAKKHDGFVEALEIAAATLLSVTIYQLTRQAFHAENYAALVEPSFLERGVVTNVLFLSGLTYYLAGRHFHRTTLNQSAAALSAIALFRIVCFDVLLYNPVWTHQFVGSLPVSNYLLLPFALPIVWSVLTANEMRSFGRGEVASGLYGLAFVLLLILVTLNVRQLFWGGYLDDGSFADSEFYTYSVAWLLTGVGLLIVGTIREERMIRRASLVVMMIAVAKVFIFDASVLQGLYRVLSFFGLGIVLIALSWFYSRFVFVAPKTRTLVN
jgi:uncharacterized membrane protein